MKKFHFLSIFYSFIVAIVFIPSLINAQIDNEFWFAAPEVSNFHNLDRPILLRIISYDFPTDVTIHQPAGGGMPTQNITMQAHSIHTIDITNWIDIVESKPANTILNYGLRITSTEETSVYYEISSHNNPEIFSLKGKNALGTDFWIPSQNLLLNDANYTPQPYSSFDIIATEDNTTITITPSQDIVGHNANIPFQINLNKGQTYSATVTGQLPTSRPHGSKVVSDKLIAITVKDDLVFGGTIYGGNCADLGGDQIVPTTLLGTKYVAVNGELYQPGDYLFITATENNTQIFKDDILTTTLNASETYQMLVVGDATFIEANNPISVWQLSGAGCEIGLTQLPALTSCSGSRSISYIRSSSQILNVNIIMHSSGNLNNFTVNNNPSVITAAQFNVVPGSSGEWMFAKIQLPSNRYPEGDLIRIENSSAPFQIGILDGEMAGGMSYGYFSDYGLLDLKISAEPNPACVGDNILISANSGNISGISYEWTGPNNFSSNQKDIFLENVKTLETGIYTLNMDADMDDCSITREIQVTINELPIVDLGPDTTLCLNSEEVVLQSSISYNNNLTYSWSTGENTQSIVANQTGLYTLTVDNDGCIGEDSIFIEQLSLPNQILGEDIEICHGDSIELSPIIAEDAKVLWNTGETTPHITIQEEGEYWIQVNYPICELYDTIKVTNVFCGCELYVPNAFSPNNDGMNDIFTPVFQSGCPITSYSLQIFNRWGQLIFKSINPNEGWNGMFNNKKVELGTYMYIISYSSDYFPNKRTKKGDLTLLY